DVLSFAWSHLPETRAYAPDLVEEVEGIASGADVPFEKVWFLNCFDEAGNYRLYRDRNAFGHACTTFAATGRSTVGGVTYIGQNWDISDWYDCVILDIKPGHGRLARSSTPTRASSAAAGSTAPASRSSGTRSTPMIAEPAFRALCSSARRSSKAS